MSAKEAMAVEAVKVAPPGIVGGLSLYGVPLSDVVLGLTALYTVLALYFLIRDKWWRDNGRKE